LLDSLLQEMHLTAKMIQIKGFKSLALCTMTIFIPNCCGSTASPEVSIRNTGIKSKWYTYKDKEEFEKRLQIGDLIEFFRAGGYSHWAIHYGGGQDDGDQQLKDHVYAHRGAPPGWNPMNLLKRSEISSVVSSALPQIVPGVEGTYKQGLAAIAKDSRFRINNEYDKHSPPLTPSEIRERCNTVKPPYNLLTENCETFALWARNDMYMSRQILKLLSILVGVYLTFCVFQPLLSNLSNLVTTL